jgi:Family of unknown function (DUF6353)
MTLIDITRKLERLAVDNSPSLLTGLGVVGVVATGFLSFRAGFKSAQILHDAHFAREVEGDEEPFTFTEKVKEVWPEIVPPVVTGAGTVAAVIGAHTIGSRRTAAVAAAYSLSEKAYAEYRDKVQEKIGEKKEQKVRDEIAQERVDKNPVSTSEVIITGNGEVMCYDSLTGRYFKSTMENIRKAENEINKQIISHDYATLTDFYDKLGLRATSFSNEVGWNTDRMLEVRFSTVISDDNQPCISIDYDELPIREYFLRH